MGVTHLFYRKDKIVGYITVAMGSIKKEKTILQIDNYEKVNYPALWLGRLAVDNTEREQGVGTHLLEYCVDMAIRKAKKEIGCRFIVLVTQEGFRTDFYTKHGFKKANIKLENNLKVMYFQLF
jgi:predicted GNAT family N-acyltransferase